MKFRKILIISSAALLLGACGGNKNNSNNASSSVKPGSITKPTASFDKALAKDYSNCTILSYQSYNDGESSETDYEYVADGLICDYSWDLAQSGYDYQSCLSYYTVDNKGESWTFWEAEKGTANSKGGWLQKGYHNSDLSIWNAYFYLPNLLNNLSASDVAMSNGVYYLKSNEKIKQLNDSAFGYAWFNDIIDIAMIVNDEGYISHIFGFCDEDDNGDPKNYVEIIIDNFGTTEVPYASRIPELGDDTKTTYWQYKGWPHDYEEAYYTDIHAKVSDASEVTGDATHDVVAELDDRWVVEALLTPTQFNAWDLVKEENANVTWHYDPKIVSLEYARGDKAMNVHAIAPGETEIYATVKGKDKTLESEHIKVKVNTPPTQDKSNAVFDFEWVAVNPSEDGGETFSVLAANAVNTNAPYTITAGPCAKILDGKYSDQYDAGKRYMVISPSDQGCLNKTTKPGLYFDFGEQQVSKLSFNYGFFYDAHKLNISNLNQVLVRSTNDGINYNEIDITEQIKTKASGEFSKLIEVEFPAASKVEITLKASQIGKSCGITFDSVCFSKDETCNNWQDPSTVIPVSSVTAAPSSAELFVGETQVLHTLVAPNNATDKTLTWHVEEGKEGIVSVSADGTVTALAAGSAKVWATASNGVKSNEVTVTVSNMPTLTDYVGNKYVGESVSAEILSANSAKITYGSFEVTGTISGQKNDKILFSNAGGESFALEFSHSTLFVSDIKYLDNGTIKSPLRTSFDAELQVYMTSFNVKVGSLTPNASGKYEVLVGDTTYLSLSSFAPSNANVTSVTYSSSDKTIATVAGQDASYDEEEGYSGAYGTVRFLKAGEVTITVASKNDPSVKKEIKFVVKDNVYPNDTNWSIAPSATEVDATSKVTFSTSFDSSITTDKTITWSVNNKVDPAKPTNATINTKTGELNVGTVAGQIEVIASVKGANGSTIQKKVTITVKEAASGSVVAAEACGTWNGADNWETPFTFTVNANGKATLRIDGSTYNFTYRGVSSGVYTFVYDNNSSVTIDLDMDYLGDVGFALNDDGGIINDYASVCFYETVAVTK
ncbi:MAG: Ig-like domain-containing protein [Bacilli bacterium]|nr:Ig-like domain-containing protein [Bacilli bacterium]